MDGKTLRMLTVGIVEYLVDVIVDLVSWMGLGFYSRYYTVQGWAG